MPQMQFPRVQKKTEILSIRPPELRTSNVFSTRSERASFPPRSRRQWRFRRKPNTANVRRSCRSEGDQQSNNIATVMNNIHQFKIPAHRLNRSRSAQEINKHVSDDVRAENKPKTEKTKEAKDFNMTTVALITKEDLNVNGFQQRVSMMSRTSEQISDVSRGNTAALVVIKQFLLNLAL